MDNKIFRQSIDKQNPKDCIECKSKIKDYSYELNKVGFCSLFCIYMNEDKKIKKESK